MERVPASHFSNEFFTIGFVDARLVYPYRFQRLQPPPDLDEKLPLPACRARPNPPPLDCHGWPLLHSGAAAGQWCAGRCIGFWSLGGPGIFYMGVSKNRGTPKSSILIGFSIINHPFWGTPSFGNTHIRE